ncbi:hypothetical protein [Candidatus Protochlamydia sp. W-9]|uniref:hypothetical protein n=1 Tax=Candidatus Protochlamydia sp. W-9 TaxID=1785087 RepID=UPI00096A5055|nr:hypothetical protein [Candidatus Protochlamydia sp. W-9]
MNNWTRRCFHFLGGVYLAIFLISALALIVIAGTFLESYTNSHLFAAEWTYHSPFFLSLLGLMFVNILISALRRWPFQKKHIPFLITHLGLLMVIGGTIIKQQMGIQGNLSLTEGSGSQTLLIPHTFALKVEQLNPPFEISRQEIRKVALEGGPHLHQFEQFPTLKLKILGHAPHVNEQWETWIKGEKAYFSGIPPFPIQSWQTDIPFPKGILLPLSTSSSAWLALALRTDHLKESLQNFYLENLTVRLTSKTQPDIELEIPLQLALEKGILFEQRKIHFDLNLNFSSIQGLAPPTLNLSWKTPSDIEQSIQIALQGNHSLYMQYKNSWTLSAPFNVDLIRPTPALLIVEDWQKNTYLFAFDKYGRVHEESFKQNQFYNLIAYAQGHGGYVVQAEIPFPSFPASRLDKEKADEYFLQNQLQQVFSSTTTLIPPLKLFQQACQRSGYNFVDAFVEFLHVWNDNHTPLFSSLSLASPTLQESLSHLNWELIPKEDYHGCQWTCLFFEDLQKTLQADQDLLVILHEKSWPGLKTLATEESKNEILLTHLIQQIFSASSYLPLPLIEEKNVLYQAQLLSAYFKAYDIDYHTLIQRGEVGEENYERLHAMHPTAKEKILLETPLTYYHQTKEPLQKKENNRPALFLEAIENDKKQIVSLAYDESATGLKWPILNGQYLIRFQPQQISLPYRLRLRQARQINYPHTQQTYSYEGDVLITNNNQEEIALTLSMNKVYETWDGFRFYLAGMTTASSQTANHVQVIVNQDPAKYLLTYPGGLIVTIGTILLFWLKPYRKRD